ncbi:hypothetical protein NV391_06910 [Companilactobacillus crustorum]|uniref:hypothetical protein n=1 Tax=Companilactobacillus crustorum TaxID=392416 RepID=UPI00237EB9B6|nr:hypothetical protein [Companilactobacillus crustorum]WDT64723.1 hypothetical protein NV391_06910 [Companilactobacillus crustorum]
MNNLSNEIVHLSKVLEKQIPKGYHEIVAEYVRQNITGAIYDLLVMAFCILVVYFIIRTIKNANQNKKDSMFFENYDDPDISMLGIIAVPVVVIIGIAVLIIFVSAFLDIRTAIQHAVAPNYYLIKSFIK